MEHIRFSDVYFFYKSAEKGFPALEAVDFEVEHGETFCVAGANGCGKSTLLQLAAGCLKPSRGEITFEGCDYNLKDYRRTGIVFQEPDYQLFMPTVWEDVAFGVLKGGMTADCARETALAALKSVEAEHIAERPPHTLSGGEKQRAALAGILVTRPEVLILDEPSAALDPRMRKNLIALLRKIKCTKIIASHDLDLVLELADRVLFLDRGKTAALCGAPGLLLDEFFLKKIGLELPLSAGH